MYSLLLDGGGGGCDSCLRRSRCRCGTLEIKVFEGLRVYVVKEDLPGPRLTDSVAVAKEFEPSEDLFVVGLDFEANFVIADARNDATGDNFIGILWILQHVLVSPLRLFLCRQEVGAKVRHVLGLNNNRLLVSLVTIKMKFIVNIFNAANATLRKLVDLL
jgi:hypothetical protein